MKHIRRNQLLLVGFVLLILIFIWIWLHLPFAEISKLWNQPDIKTIILALIPALISAAIIGIFVLFSKAIINHVKKLINPRGSENDRQRLEQEKQYLQNFISVYQDNLEPNSPWEVTKYTDMEALHRDQGKHARLVDVQPLWRRAGAEDVPAEEKLGARVNIQSFLRSEKGPIMIKGEPGTGKTLTIRRFAYDQAIKAKNSAPGTVKLPIYIPLSRYTGRTNDGKEPEPVIDFIRRYLKDNVPTSYVIYENLEKYLSDGRLLLLFDGLNELLQEEYLVRFDKLRYFVAQHSLNKAVFTCRTPRYTADTKFVTVELSDLDNEQIENFIAAYRGERAARTLYQELTSGDGFMLRVCRNPFMLRMLVMRDPTRRTPDTPAQLFEEYVQYQLISEGTRASEIDTVLRDMAFAMQKGGQFAGTVDYNWLETQLPGVPLDEYLKIADQKYLLNYISGENVSFYHQILQEYFAAAALKEEWQAGKSVLPYFSDYRWEDTVIVCAGLIKDPEAFISGIWSSEQADSENFWLALKTLGYSGGQEKVSQQYYDSIIQEAEWYLSGRNTDTVLAVDTIKALSYVDDENVALILSDTLVDSEGWLRELCIQTLGSSRQPRTQELLRESIVKLHSFPDLLLAAPYFSKAQWLTMLASSTITFDRVVNLFWQMTRLLWYLTPAVLIGILLIGSRFFKMDPFVLFGRALALTILALMLVRNTPKVQRIVRRQTPTKEKLIDFRDLLLSEIMTVILFVAFWFFFLETSFLLGIILAFLSFLYFIALALALVLSLFNPLRLFSLLHSRAYRVNIFLTAFVVALYASRFFLPSLSRPTAQLHTTYSSVSSVLLHIYVLIYDSPIEIGVGVLILVMGVASILVYIITYIKYWRLRQYYDSFMRKGDTRAAQYLVQIAVKNSEWVWVRIKALKYLRQSELPTSYISELDALLVKSRTGLLVADETWIVSFASFFQDKVNFRSELERTVYDLIHRAREEAREIPDEKYLATLVNRGRSLYKGGFYSEALTYLKQAITLNGQYAPAYALCAEIYRHMENYTEALDALDHALLNNAQDASSLALRGEVYLGIGHPHEAAADLTQAILLKKDDPKWFTLLGRALRLSGHGQEAIENFNQALELDEQYWSAFVDRGETYMLLAQYPEAIADFTQAIAIYDQDDWLYYCRALVYLAQGQTNLFDLDMQSAIQYAQMAAPVTQSDSWRLKFNFALYKLVMSEETEAQSLYEQLHTTCTSVYSLQGAAEDLSDFISIQSSNQLAHQILSQLQDRINELNNKISI